MELKDLLQTVKALKFPSGEHCVIGSGALMVHGIREAKDIDLLVTRELFEQLRTNSEWEEIFEHRRKLRGKGVEVMDTINVGEYTPDIRAILSRAEMIDNVPFLSLSDLVDFKRACARSKDFEDIQLIERYLKSKEEELSV